MRTSRREDARPLLAVFGVEGGREELFSSLEGVLRSAASGILNMRTILRGNQKVIPSSYCNTSHCRLLDLCCSLGVIYLMYRIVFMDNCLGCKLLYSLLNEPN